MRIRDAAEEDLPAIVAIFNAAVPTRMSTAVLEPVSVEERVPWFREHSPGRHPLLVLEINDQIAGWLSFHSFMTRCGYRGTAEVSVYVHRNFRRLGVARTLLNEGIVRGPALELSAVLGLILGHNTASLQLFDQLGFERWGILPRVARLDEVERDVVIVGRHLNAAVPTRSRLSP